MENGQLVKQIQRCLVISLYRTYVKIGLTDATQPNEEKTNRNATEMQHK